jgi:hypothetical protein
MSQSPLTHTAEEAREREQEGDKKKGGALSSLIYGTPAGRDLDKDIERSFSQVLARGKYVHSIVFHDVKPDKQDEYTELVGKWYPKMAGIPENKVHLVGSWRTEVGDCNTFGKLHAHSCAKCSYANTNGRQYISGSTSATRVTINPYTTYRNTPISPISIRNSRN